MQVPRIYLPAPLTNGNRLELGKQAAHHLLNVLRLKPGATLILFDGRGNACQATLEPSAQVTVGQPIQEETESPLRIRLIQAISRGERMDHVIQKAVELGVDTIIPVSSQRSMVKLRGERAANRLRHWQGIIVSACEQCGRSRLPVLNSISTLDAALSEPEQGSRLVLDPAGGNTLSNLSAPDSSVTLLIGPEGGLSADEIHQAERSGFTGVRLGPRTLRTETAAITVLSALQVLWGDLG